MLPLSPSQSGLTRDGSAVLRGFSWPNARACAERCELAYQETTRSLADKGLNGRVVTNAATDTEALVVDEGDCISIAFRGSQALKDWIQDFKVKREHPRTELFHDDAGSPAEIHTGFMEDVDSVSDDLSHVLGSLLSTLNAQPKPVFVTGHSKGGGEAILFAIELARRKYTVAGVYTFGQPRVGNQAFANIYNAATNGDSCNSSLRDITFRVVNQNDIVPRLPGVLMGYRHCGQEIFLPVGGGWSLNPPLWSKLFSDALGLWGAYRTKSDVLVAEHKIGAYQSRIQLL